MTDSCKLSCPFCDKQLSYRIWFEHIVKQHKSDMFSSATPEGRMNTASLTFKADRSSLPTIKFKGMDTRYVCWSCMGAFSKDSVANKHLPHLRQSVQIATDLKETLTLNPLETPPLASDSSLTNLQELAYQRVVLDLTQELEDKLWYFEKWNKARSKPEINELLEELSDVEPPEYDLKGEHKKEAKHINLDRSHIEKACKQKLP